MSYPNGQAIWDYLSSFIGNDYGVSGLMGNLYAESGLLPFRLQGDYDSEHDYPVSHEYSADVNDGTISEYTFVHDGKGYGLAQWTSSGRKQGLYTLCLGGTYYGIDSLQKQLEYIEDELTNGYSGVLTVLQNATSILSASNKVLFDYESPQDQSLAEQIKRWNYSRDIYNTYSGQPPIPPTPPFPTYRRKMKLYFYTLKQARYKKGIL